jgi:glucuronate isomerase
MDEDFLLQSKTAVRLYHDFARDLPIIDYHNHLPPADIARNTQFENITQAWLYGDHYKWRAMRANGVSEDFITGKKTDRDKFFKWAETVPYTLRNPLYHWTHLELRRFFGITALLDSKSANTVYEDASWKLLEPDFSARRLLEKMKVEILCTTDEPLDDLAYHARLREEGYAIKVLPAFRCDVCVNISNRTAFSAFLEGLQTQTGTHIRNFPDYLDALKKRHDYFSKHGCTVSDIGLDRIYAEEYRDWELDECFELILKKESLTAAQESRFKSAVLEAISSWNAEKGWVQQFHLGAMRNTNSRMMQQLGANTGWDSIGDYAQGPSLAKFLDRLDSKNRLAKTILYNLNPSDNELFATMAGNFNDGSVAGKIQWGSAWWFLDQKDGITDQLNVLSNMGLLSRFVGMLTDSRSFLSFPRHEYFRRILCNLLGDEIENGELPNDLPWTGKIIQDICYYNARTYFGW